MIFLKNSTHGIAEIEDGVDQIITFVVTLGPVGLGLTEDEIIGAEDLTEGAGGYGVHGGVFQTHEDCAGDIASSGGFVEIDVDALWLKIRVTVVGTGGVNAVLVSDGFPELGADLVPGWTT